MSVRHVWADAERVKPRLALAGERFGQQAVTKPTIVLEGLDPVVLIEGTAQDIATLAYAIRRRSHMACDCSHCAQREVPMCVSCGQDHPCKVVRGE